MHSGKVEIKSHTKQVLRTSFARRFAKPLLKTTSPNRNLADSCRATSYWHEMAVKSQNKTPLSEFCGLLLDTPLWFFFSCVICLRSSIQQQISHYSRTEHDHYKWNVANFTLTNKLLTKHNNNMQMDGFLVRFLQMKVRIITVPSVLQPSLLSFLLSRLFQFSPCNKHGYTTKRKINQTSNKHRHSPKNVKKKSENVEIAVAMFLFIIFRFWRRSGFLCCWLCGFCFLGRFRLLRIWLRWGCGWLLAHD